MKNKLTEITNSYCADNAITMAKNLQQLQTIPNRLLVI